MHVFCMQYYSKYNIVIKLSELLSASFAPNYNNTVYLIPKNIHANRLTLITFPQQRMSFAISSDVKREDSTET